MKIAAAQRSGHLEAVATPRRLQRPRGCKAHTPPGAIYVGRPSMWTNPFRSERFGHVRAIRLHRRWLAGELTPRFLRRLGFSEAEIGTLYRLRLRVLAHVHLLAGHDLQCWCPLTSRHCHADLLLTLANAGEGACA